MTEPLYRWTSPSFEQCKNCELHKTAANLVKGIGHKNPRILLLGEGPGFHEDKTGRPFVGAAGQLLQAELNNLPGIQMTDIYVTNVVKHRPPGNRKPTNEELLFCSLWLVDEIKAVNPQHIICLGRTAAEAVYAMAKLPLPRGSLRGRTTSCMGIPTTITWHPAYILRNMDRLSELQQDLTSSYNRTS